MRMSGLACCLLPGHGSWRCLLGASRHTPFSRPVVPTLQSAFAAECRARLCYCCTAEHQIHNSRTVQLDFLNDQPSQTLQALSGQLLTAMLNPNAPVFVPQMLEHAFVDNQAECWAWEERQEQEPTQDELDELEAVEAWVEMMVEFDEAEKEHLIAYALQEAPAAAQVIEEEVEKQQREPARRGKVSQE